jgi:type I restriction enzyme S subunit
MKKGWEIKKIKDIVVDLHQGLNTAGYRIEFYDTGYPIIQTRNLENGVIDLDEKMKFMSEADWLLYKDKYKPKVGNVFLTNIGTIGKTAVVTEEQDYLIHWNIFIFKLKFDLIDPFYLKSFLDTPFCFDYYRSQQKGGTVNFITKKMIEALEIPIPPLPEQQRIVSILDEAFAAIAKAKANAEQNLKNASALFESYLQGVFENKGEGWEEKTLGEVCEYDKIPHDKSDLPYVGLEDIQSNSGLFIGTIEPKSVKSTTFSFSSEHVLYGRLRPYLNKVLLPNFEGHCSTEIFPIKPKKNVLDRTYLFHWLIATETMKKINATWTGATLPRANMNTVLDFKLIVPPLKTQQTIVRQLDALSAETKKLETIYQQKINDLEELKKSILQKAFAGELNVGAGFTPAQNNNAQIEDKGQPQGIAPTKPRWIAPTKRIKN